MFSIIVDVRGIIFFSCHFNIKIISRTAMDGWNVVPYYLNKLKPGDRIEMTTLPRFDEIKR